MVKLGCAAVVATAKPDVNFAAMKDVMAWWPLAFEGSA
jgi:hypothetical protein